MKTALREKIRESLTSVLPIALIIIILALTLTPLDTSTLVLFLVGVFLLTFGMELLQRVARAAFFSVGAQTEAAA